LLKSRFEWCMLTFSVQNIERYNTCCIIIILPVGLGLYYCLIEETCWKKKAERITWS